MGIASTGQPSIFLQQHTSESVSSNKLPFGEVRSVDMDFYTVQGVSQLLTPAAFSWCRHMLHALQFQICKGGDVFLVPQVTSPSLTSCHSAEQNRWLPPPPVQLGFQSCLCRTSVKTLSIFYLLSCFTVCSPPPTTSSPGNSQCTPSAGWDTLTASSRHGKGPWALPIAPDLWSSILFLDLLWVQVFPVPDLLQYPVVWHHHCWAVLSPSAEFLLPLCMNLVICTLSCAPGLTVV